MTAREFYENVLTLPELPAELAEYATAAIAGLNDKNAKRKTSPAALARQAGNDNLKGAIVALLADGNIWTAAEIAAKLSTPENEVSTQKASALARQLAEDGTISVEDYKVTGKGAVKGYSIPNEEPEFEGEDGEDVPAEG